MNELLIQVDEQDNVIGPIDRLKAHLDDGILHRGLMVVVMNDQNHLLLTQRSMKRPDLAFPPAFPSFWDVTLAGHPKWGQTDYVTQMTNEVREELGIESSGDRMEYIGKFQYHASDPTYPNPKPAQALRLSEREVCGVGLLRTSENPHLNAAELQASMWVERPALQDRMRSLKVAPWALIMIEKFPDILND